MGKLIPKILHHVWPGQDPFRAEFHGFREGWMRHHPDWTFMFWRGNEPFINDARVSRVLNNADYSVIVKSDVLRLYVLVTMGGLYVDTDFECLRSFDDLLSTGGFHCGREVDTVLCPSLMACAAGDSFGRAYLDAAIERLQLVGPTLANRRPDQVTGPRLLTELADSATITCHAREVFYPVYGFERHRLSELPPSTAYARHHWHGSTPTGWLGSQRLVHDEADETRALEAIDLALRDGQTRRPNAATTPTGDLRFDLGGIGRGSERKTVNLVGDSDIRADIIELDQFCEDGTVSEFYLSHTLEHVPVEVYETFLRGMVRKLRPGGVLRVVQTDADAVIQQYARGELCFRSMRSTLFTPPDRLVGNPHQAHRNCWSAAELARDFTAAGLNTEVFDAGGWGMDMTDPFYPNDIRADWGKPIKNLGVLGHKPGVAAAASPPVHDASANNDWRYSES